MGAPAAAAYKGQAGGVIEALDNLLDKANAELDEARQAEVTAKNNFELLKQSLSDEIRYANKDLAGAKKGIEQSAETKATAEGDLTATKKDLAEDEKALETLHHDCMTKATAFEEETKSRGEELAAIAEAKKILKETTGGSEKITQ